MPSIYNSLANQLQKVNSNQSRGPVGPGGPAGPAGPGVPRSKSGRQRNNAHKPILQTLPKPMIWDWDIPVTGTMNDEVYNFCDKIPSDFKSKVYNPSARSFSENYKHFLDMIKIHKFPIDIAKTLGINNPTGPLYPADGGIIPHNWSIISMDSSVNDLQRAYSISEYPSKWLASLAGGNKIPIDLEDDTGKLQGTNSATQLNALQTGVEFGYTAEAWNTISISPASWYNGAIVSVVRSNRNTYTKVKNATIFGVQGFIPCRVSSFLVALNPTAYVKIDKSKNNNLPNVNDIRQLNVGGFSFTDEASGPNELTSSFTIETLPNNIEKIRAKKVSTDDKMYIIGVLLERL